MGTIYDLCGEWGNKGGAYRQVKGKKAFPVRYTIKNLCICRKPLKNTKSKNLDYSTTETICRNCLSLPMHPYMEKSEIDLVCSSVLEICQTQGC